MTDAFDIASSGLIAQRLRMDTISSNIANRHTTRDVNGNLNPYRRRMVTFQSILNDKTGQNAGVQVAGIIEDDQPLNMVYDPANPDADDEGYVAMPNISVEQEMTDMVMAEAAYQANITSIEVYKKIFESSLNL